MLRSSETLTQEEKEKLRREQEQAKLRIRESAKYRLPNSQRVLPKDYNGIRNSFGCLAAGAQSYLARIAKTMAANPQSVLESWPEVIGPAHAGMCRARGFVDGVLEVSVGNSLLYSLLRQHEYFKVLKALRERNPTVEIHKIKFVRV